MKILVNEMPEHPSECPYETTGYKCTWQQNDSECEPHMKNCELHTKYECPYFTDLHSALYRHIHISVIKPR